MTNTPTSGIPHRDKKVFAKTLQIYAFFQLSGTVEANFWCEKIEKLSGHDMLQFFIMFYFFKQSILLFVRVIYS